MSLIQRIWKGVVSMAKKSVLSVSELSNPCGLPKALVEAFITNLGRLAELDADIARRTTRYVVDGTDEDVLLTLSGLDPKASQVCFFTLSCITDQAATMRRGSWNWSNAFS